MFVPENSQRDLVSTSFRRATAASFHGPCLVWGPLDLDWHDAQQRFMRDGPGMKVAPWNWFRDQA